MGISEWKFSAYVQKVIPIQITNAYFISLLQLMQYYQKRHFPLQKMP